MPFSSSDKTFSSFFFIWIWYYCHITYNWNILNWSVVMQSLKTLCVPGRLGYCSSDLRPTADIFRTFHSSIVSFFYENTNLKMIFLIICPLKIPLPYIYRKYSQHSSRYFFLVGSGANNCPYLRWMDSYGIFLYYINKIF